MIETLSSASQPLLEEAAAIRDLAAKLQPMVKRAQQLQAARERLGADGGMSAALAAVAGADEGEVGGDRWFRRLSPATFVSSAYSGWSATIRRQCIVCLCLLGGSL